MKIDLTLEITPTLLLEAKENQKPELEGHLGTHFDVMDQAFPLAYTERKAVVFDVTHVKERDIDLCDIDLSRIEAEQFVAFHSGFSDTEPYGTRRYYKEHPQLSTALINALLEKQISIIGIDFAGVRRGAEHIPTDQACAEKGVFVIENLRHLETLFTHEGPLVFHTYPMHMTGITGLPCRVIAEIEHSGFELI